jgi:ParB family chromosome partitioning protein
MESKRQWMATNRPKTVKIFRSLFPGNNGLAEIIGNHMRKHDYDQSQPVILWDRTEEEGRNALYVVDGHTRLVAAKQVGLDRVYVARVKFSGEEAALQYAIHNQRDRRNMTDADILRCIDAVDKLKPRGGDRRSESAKSNGSSEPIECKTSAQETADIVGTSETKVKKARAVMRHGDEDTKNDVIAGKKSLHRAYQETQNKRRPHREEEKKDDEDLSRIFVTLPDHLEEKIAMMRNTITGAKKRVDDIQTACTPQEWNKIKGRLISAAQEVVYHINDLGN